MIPNIIHFVFGMTPNFGGIPFSLPHYLAIKSAYEVNRPDKMFFHYKWIPRDNPWWDKAKKYVEPVHTEPPTMIYGNKITNVANMTDVIRLRVLNWVGGTYLDIDTLCVKPLSDFRQHKFVMGLQEGFFAGDGLCNALIMAEPNSEFGKLWMDSFITFDCEKWDEHAVRLPRTISQMFPHLIHIEPEFSFFHPTSANLPLLYEQCIDGRDKKYIYHLWEHSSWETYLSKVDEEWIRTSPSTYATEARKFL